MFSSLTYVKTFPYFLLNSTNFLCGSRPINGKYPRIGIPLGPGGSDALNLLPSIIRLMTYAINKAHEINPKFVDIISFSIFTV